MKLSHLMDGVLYTPISRLCALLASLWAWIAGWLYTRQTLYVTSCAILIGLGTFFWWLTGTRQEPPGATEPPPPEKVVTLPLPRRPSLPEADAAEALPAQEAKPEKPAPEGPKFKRKLVPFDAAKIALLDALQYDPVKDTPFLRYLFIPDKPDDWVPTLNFAVNMCVSQSSFIQYGVQIHPNVLRYDLRLLAPQAADLDVLINTWEQFAFDPYFHEFVVLEDNVDLSVEQTQDALKNFLQAVTDALAAVNAEIGNLGSNQGANVDQVNRDAALKALADFRVELGKLSNEQEQVEFLKLADLDARLRKPGGVDAAFFELFQEQATAAIEAAQVDGFKEKLAALVEAVAQTVQSGLEAAVQAAAVARQKVVATLKVAQLKAELSRARLFDLVFLNQLVKDIDAAILALAKDKVAAKLVETLKVLRDTVRRLADEAAKTQNVEVAGRRSAQGGLGNNVEIPIPARHAGVALALLFQLTQSDAALTFGPHFLHRTCSTIDLGHGAGLYYDFVGIRANQNDGLNDFQRFLADFGIDLEQVDVLRSKNSAAVYTSNVTGRERKVVFVQGSGVRPGVAGGLVVYTQDPGENQTDAANSPIRNLIDFEFAAQEAIADRPNGMLAWALFDAAGTLQLNAPDFVVADHSVPSPYCTRLHCPISCVRCHGPQRGHMSVKNDVELLTSKRIDILDDLSSADDLDDLLDRLVGEYRWLPDDPTSRAPIVRSRDDFADAIYRATAGIGRSGLAFNQVYQFPRGWSASEACGKMGELWNAYAYQWVTPKVALAELGYEVDNEKDALALIKFVIPAVGPDDFALTILDPTVAAIRMGIPVPRASYELVYFDIALRSLITAPAIAAGEISKQKIRSLSGRKPLTQPHRPRKDWREQLKNRKLSGKVIGKEGSKTQGSKTQDIKVKSQVAP